MATFGSRASVLLLALTAAAGCLAVAAEENITTDGEEGNLSNLRGGNHSAMQGNHSMFDIFNDGDGQRHACTWLNYQSPLSYGHVVAFFNTITPKHSSESTFFATNTQGFGYMGLQQVEHRGMFFEGIAIFSIWDDNCNHVMDPDACPLAQQVEIVECGDIARCSRFGGEGTGAKSTIGFHEWELEQSYSFLVMAKQDASDKVLYEGYFYAPELGGWKLLSKLRVPVGNRPWYIHSMGSFVEQWDTSSSDDVRWARYGPAFVEGNYYGSWTQITRATWSHTMGANENQNHVDGKVTNYGRQWGMGIGGSTVKTLWSGTTLEITTPSMVPPELVTFNTLRSSGQLPTGCAGGTCTSTLIAGWVSDAFSKTYIVITVLAAVACLIFAVPAVCMCRGRANMKSQLLHGSPPHRR